jgi:hypothetical protein
MASSWKNYSMATTQPNTQTPSDVNWNADTTERFHDSVRQIDHVASDLAIHEAQCEERWKTTFTRLDAIDGTLQKMDGRMLSVGGTIIMFLAGVIAALLNMGA